MHPHFTKPPSRFGLCIPDVPCPVAVAHLDSKLRYCAYHDYHKRPRAIGRDHCRADQDFKSILKEIELPLKKFLGAPYPPFLPLVQKKDPLLIFLCGDMGFSPRFLIVASSSFSLATYPSRRKR